MPDGALGLVSMVGEILYRGGLPDWRRFITPQTSLAMALIAVMILSAHFHPSELTNAEVARQITIVMYVFVTIHFLNTPQRLRHVTGVFVVVATLLSSQSLYPSITGPGSASEEWVPGAGRAHWHGTAWPRPTRTACRRAWPPSSRSCRPTRSA